jgi:predicted DCC family thiol-disulfide oxidoreductase YuxK
MSDHPIILFDGVCNLCNGAVQFIIKRDPGSRFRFASLQSEEGQKLQQKFGLNPNAFNSIVLIENQKAFVQSDAALRIARGLKGWSWLWGFRIVPRAVRDGVYDFISANRYRIFGKKEECMIPTPEMRERFI